MDVLSTRHAKLHAAQFHQMSWITEINRGGQKREKRLFRMLVAVTDCGVFTQEEPSHNSRQEVEINC